MKTKINNNPENRRLLSKHKRELSRRYTSAEKHVERLLKELGERFMAQKGFLHATTHFIVDFYLPKPRKICLEVDGGYHSNPSQAEYDNRRDAYLRDVRGLRVIRITNEAAEKLDAAGLAEVLESLLTFW